MPITTKINDTNIIDFQPKKYHKDSITDLIISVDRLIQLLQNGWVPPYGKDESFYYGWAAAFQTIRDSSVTDLVYDQMTKILRKDSALYTKVRSNQHLL
jgi:hypothetical protein